MCEILFIPTWQWGVMTRTWDFGNMCTVTLTLEIWSCFKVITHYLVMYNKCVKYYQDPIWQWGVMVRTRISGMCALLPWPWRYDFGQIPWHSLGSWTTIAWNNIWIGQVVNSYGPDAMWTNIHRQTDGQGDSHIPPNFVCGEGIKTLPTKEFYFQTKVF